MNASVGTDQASTTRVALYDISGTVAPFTREETNPELGSIS